MFDKKADSASGVFVYRPNVAQFAIAIGLIFFLMSLIDYMESRDFKKEIIPFIQVVLPFYILFVIYLARFAYTKFDLNKRLLTHRNHFFVRRIPISDIVSIRFGGTYAILQGTYRSLFIIHRPQSGVFLDLYRRYHRNEMVRPLFNFIFKFINLEEQFFKIHEGTFRNEQAISEFLKHLKELNPNIELDANAQQVMTEGKVPRRGL